MPGESAYLANGRELTNPERSLTAVYEIGPLA
jgi:hypothetical protein